VIPGGGSILAAIATASGVAPIIAGKPFAPMGELVRRELKLRDLSSCWMIGDRYSTDGAFAKTIGAKFALALSGVIDRSGAERLQNENKFELVVEDLFGLVKHLGIAV
jgi:ribonucleotide monophosphatase NagD (HAD superfamily)